MMRPYRLFGTLAVAGMLAASYGCAEHVGDIDRTQPNKLHKSLFRPDRTWYFKQTIADVSTNSSNIVGDGAGVYKIRFEVTEDKLVAWRVYEHYPGQNPRVDPFDKDIGATEWLDGLGRGVNPTLFKDTAVAMWPVTDHFDVIRQYNSTTGEPSNVLVEDSSDRPWYERAYMRVNWAAQAAPSNAVFASGSAVPIRITSEGEEPAGNQAAIHFEDAEGNIFDSRTRRLDDAVVYFDVTDHRTGGQSSADRTTNWVDIRNSFWRIDAERDQDYEPALYDDVKMSKFGYFRTERNAYSRRRGFVDENEIRMANRHRIWEHSYQRGEDGKLLRDADGDRITIPFADRVPKPIVYYASPNHPRELMGTVREIAREWDQSFRRATAFSCGLDVPDGHKIDSIEVTGHGRTCAELKALGKLPNMFVLDENIPSHKIHRADASGFDYTRRSTPQEFFPADPGIWGSTGVALDGTTELITIHFDAQLWSERAVVQWRQEDSMDLDLPLDGEIGAPQALARNGDLRKNFIYWVDKPAGGGLLGFGPSYADPETGELISGTAYVYGAAVDRRAAYAMDIIDVLGGFLTIEDLADGENIKAQMRANRDKVDPRRWAGQAAEKAGMSEAEFMELPVQEALEAMMQPDMRSAIDIIEVDGFEEIGPRYEQNMLDRIRGTSLEDYMLYGDAGREFMITWAQNDDFQRAAVAQNGYDWKPGDPVPNEFADVMNPLDWSSHQASKEVREARINYYAKRNMMLDEFVDDAVIGLALEYKDESDPEKVYQDLRGKIYEGVMLHEIGHTIGLRHNFEGSFDAVNYHDEYWALRNENLEYLAEKDNISISDVTRETILTEGQRKGRMNEFQYSTTMEYGMKFNSDIQGLGKYDHAAILFGYANGVEVFTEAREDVLGRLESFMIRLGASPDLDYDAYMRDTWEERTHPSQGHPLRQFNYTHMPYFLGGIEGMRKRRLVDYDELARMRKLEEPPTDMPLEVPYLFCGDEYVGFIMSCNRWDQGANYHEITQTALSAYHNNYFFTHFRRNRSGFSSQAGYTASSRYFDLLTATYKYGLWNGAMWGRLPDPALSYLWTQAIYAGFNTLLDVVSTPDYGTYVLQDDGRYHLFSRDTDENARGVQIPKGVGRRRNSRFWQDEGYNYYQYPLEAGHFWEWYAAMQSLVSSSFSVLAVDFEADFRSYSIPYYLLFPEVMTRWFNGMVMRDSDAYGPRIINGELKYLTGLQEPLGDPVDLRPNFSTSWYATLFGMSFFRGNYSLQYVDQMQVFRLGGAEEVTAGAEYQLLSFADPTTGHEYGTLKRLRDYDPDGLGEPVPPPVQLITSLNALKGVWEGLPEGSSDQRRIERRINQGVEQLNILRRMYSVFGGVE